MPAKILVLDIETAPKLAYVWRFFKENISAKQVKEHGHVLSFAAKWLHNKEVMYQENRKEDDTGIIAALCHLLDEADIIIAHNGARFDLPTIRARAAVHGIRPPSPVKIIDTYLVAKKEFKFESNSLEYLSTVFDITKKGSHKEFPGFELWLECLRGNEKAWKEMKKYNIQDIFTLEELYIKMRPWMTQHPVLSVYDDPQEVTCPKCSSAHIHWRGFAYTNTGKYHRYQCQDCGGWGRGRYTVLNKNVNIINNQVQ